jgi:hypothetical protein
MQKVGCCSKLAKICVSRDFSYGFKKKWCSIAASKLMVPGAQQLISIGWNE